MFLVLTVGTTWSESTNISLETLREQYEKKLEEVRRPVVNLQARYEQELEKLKQVTQKSGALDRVLKIETERDSYLQNKEVDLSSFPELEKLRATYDMAMNRVMPDVRNDEDKVTAIYVQQLEALKKQLTQQGKMKEALEADQAIQSIEALKNELRIVEQRSANPRRNEKVAWELIGKDDYETSGALEIEEEGPVFKLRTPGDEAWIQSKVSMKSPYRIALSCATDSTNIRIYFGQCRLIFNWEVRPDQLRFWDRLSSNPVQPVDGKGKVSVGDVHDFSIEVTDKKIEVYVDGRKRAYFEGDYSKLEGPVGVGPAHGSVVTIESFGVLVSKDY